MRIPKPWLHAELPFTDNEAYHRRNWAPSEIDHDFDVRFIDERMFVQKCLDLTHASQFEFQNQEESHVENVCVARNQDGSPKKMVDVTKGEWVQKQITSGIFIHIIKNLEDAATGHINANNILSSFKPRVTDRWPCPPDQKHFYSWYTAAHVALRRNNIWPYTKDTELHYVKNERHYVDRKSVYIHGAPGAGIDPNVPISQQVYDVNGTGSQVSLEPLS